MAWDDMERLMREFADGFFLGMLPDLDAVLAPPGHSFQSQVRMGTNYLFKYGIRPRDPYSFKNIKKDFDEILELL